MIFHRISLSASRDAKYPAQLHDLKAIKVKCLFNPLYKAGAPSQHVLVPGGKHVEGMMEDAYFKMMVEFFMKELEKNYYFRDDSTTSIQLDVLSTGNRSKRRRPCKMPFTVVVYDDIRKELPFPCDFEKIIASYTKVN